MNDTRSAEKDAEEEGEEGSMDDRSIAARRSANR